MKLLSIVIPSYNVEKTLKATLDSLCKDEFIDKLEILIIDDGSKDNTANIANEYVKKYSQSVILIKKENGGHGSTVNVGIEKATGKYFKVVDGDDRLSFNGIVCLLDTIETSDVDLITSNYKQVLPDGTLAKNMDFNGVEFDKVYKFSQIDCDGSIYFGIHSSTFRTSILKEHHIRLQEHTFYVDTEYALLPIPYVETVIFIKEVVYLYTVGSATQSIDPDNFVKRYDDHTRVVKRLVEFSKTVSCDKQHTDYIYAVLSKLCFTQYMLSMFYDKDTKRGKKRAKKFDEFLKSNERLYKSLGSSLYIKLARTVNFKFLPKGNKLKNAAKKVFSLIKRITGKKKLTY